MFKSKQEIIVIQAEAIDPITTGIVFWSHDKGTAKMLFKLRKDGTSQSLAEGTIVPVLLKFNSETAEDGIGRHIYHAVIEDAVNGIVSIVLEDNILGYQGRVDGSIYIELPDSRSLDTAGRFTFHIKRSPIDEDVPELEDYFWQGFGEIMEQYHESIAEIKSEAKVLLDSLTADVTTAKTKVTQLEQSITTANTNLNARIDEINKKIDDNDVFTKAESSANVVNQIGGAESAILKKEMLVDGSEGTGSRDNNGTLVPFSDEDYASLLSIDGIVRAEATVAGRGAEMQFDFKVIEILEAKYPFIFEGLTTITEKITKFKGIQPKISVYSSLRGGGLLNTTNQPTTIARLYIKFGSAENSASSLGIVYGGTLSDLNVPFSQNNTNSIWSDGSYKILAVSKKNGNTDSGAISDGTTPAWVEVKDVRLIIELEVNGRTIIESMIANNHVENLATPEEAKAGTDTTKTMTPATTAQSIDNRAVTLASNQTIGGIKNFKDGLMINDVSLSTITRKVIYEADGVGGYFNAADKFTLGASGKIDKIVLLWSRVDDTAGTLLNYSWSQTVLSPDDLVVGNSYRIQMTTDNYKFVTFANESGNVTISGANENSVAPNRIYRIKRIIAYLKN